MRALGDGEAGLHDTRQGVEPLTLEGEDLSGSQAVPLVILIGLPTPGLVEQKEEVALLDGSRLFVVDGSIRDLQGLDIGQAGLEPAERIEADWDQVATTRDALIAVAWGSFRLARASAPGRPSLA